MTFSTIVVMFGFAAAAPVQAADAPRACVSESMRRVLEVTEAQFLSAAEAIRERVYTFAPSGP